MSFLAELGQGLIAIAFSAMVAYWISLPLYALVGIGVMLSCNVLLASVAHEQLQARPTMEEAPDLLYTAGSILLTSLAFGGAWPAIPLIFAWGAWRDRS